MNQIRLLPVVIAAALALLLLKGVGIVTQGGYVLAGSSVATAAGGSGEAAKDGSSDPTMTLPPAPTLEDSAPTIDDAVPTLPMRDAGAAGGHESGTEAASDAEHGTEGAPAEGTGPAAEGQDGATAGDVATTACEEVPAEATAASSMLESGPNLEDNCIETVGVNDHGDALPLTKDGAGNIVPLKQADGPTSEDAILDRLAERRNELDQRETELDMRFALVEAAEKRIEERTAALEALEARINAMVDEKRTLEESQFVAIVSMYELMKPKDAAAILDQLDMDVLLRVARAMNPRKMAPILGKMNPVKAKELTAGMAIDRVEPTIELAGEDLSALPQIVGQ